LVLFFPNDLLIYKISSTCFGQYFAHHQERVTEIFTAYGILLLWSDLFMNNDKTGAL
jgi:hypothetical protein